ncbi:MAG: hypothetical protein LBL08_00570 [Candidatus Nomurabacteria bacterium]|jgi:hypothetical protein|nr:hypothetical protein [Candidatus Nomurabacteria bacterium]
MYPNDNQTPAPPVYTGNSLEYLEQIAPKKPNKFQGLDKKVVIIIALALLIVISLIAMAALNSSSGPPSGAVLGARLDSLSSLIAYDDADRVNDASLKKAVAETQIVALSHKYQLSQIVTLTAGNDSQSAQITAGESVDSVISTLDAAATTSSLGRQYSAALVSQVYKIVEALQEVRGKLTSVDSQTQVDSAIVDFSELAVRLNAN